MKTQEPKTTQTAAELFERGQQILQARRPEKNPGAASKPATPFSGSHFDAAAAPAKPLEPPRPFRTAHTLVALIMERASDEEKDVLYELLADCVEHAYLPLPVVAINAPARALGLRLDTENIANHAEDFNGLAKVIIDGGWLYGFLTHVFDNVNKGKRLTPADVMEFTEIELLRLEGNIDNAREVIRETPEALAEEIRQAVAAHPELLALS